MYYVCVENDQIIGVFNYEPNVPATVTVHPVTDDEHHAVQEGTHYFDLKTSKVVPVSAEIAEQRLQAKASRTGKAFLNDTDWKVLRHIREKALGEPLSMTEEEYLDLERQRHKVAKEISLTSFGTIPGRKPDPVPAFLPKEE